jgi:hypothetical protein
VAKAGARYATAAIHRPGCEASAILDGRTMAAWLLLCCDGRDMLRYLFLRFLPRRLVPLLFLLEIYRLYRRFQSRTEPPVAPPRRLDAGTDMDGTPRYWADRSA